MFFEKTKRLAIGFKDPAPVLRVLDTQQAHKVLFRPARCGSKVSYLRHAPPPVPVMVTAVHHAVAAAAAMLLLLVIGVPSAAAATTTTPVTVSILTSNLRQQFQSTPVSGCVKGGLLLLLLLLLPTYG